MRAEKHGSAHCTRKRRAHCAHSRDRSQPHSAPDAARAFSRGAPGRDARGRRERPSAAFASASVRLVSADGGAAEARGRCGEPLPGAASPSATHYAPVQTDSISHRAAQLARRALTLTLGKPQP